MQVTHAYILHGRYAAAQLPKRRGCAMGLDSSKQIHALRAGFPGCIAVDKSAGEDAYAFRCRVGMKVAAD